MEYGEELEYDFQAELQLDLTDLWRGRLSARKVLGFTMRLPPSSRFKRAADPDGAVIAEWRSTDYILADLYDLTYAAAGAQNAKPYPRPTREGLAEAREAQKRTDERRRRLVERYERRQRELTDGKE